MAEAALDRDSAGWVDDLAPDAPGREAAVGRLHDLLLRVTRAEAARRRSSLPERGSEEIDDLCRQAANDAAPMISQRTPAPSRQARKAHHATKAPRTASSDDRAAT